MGSSYEHLLQRKLPAIRCFYSYSFWSPTFVPSLLDDKVAKNMLYIEALATVARGTMEVTRDVRDKLAALKTKGQKKEVIIINFCAK